MATAVHTPLRIRVHRDEEMGFEAKEDYRRINSALPTVFTGIMALGVVMIFSGGFVPDNGALLSAGLVIMLAGCIGFSVSG
jgi:hypothetical protein